MMTTRDWWLGVAAVVAAILLHALLPRYEWRDPGGDNSTYVRIDRWTGRSQLGEFTHVWGQPAGAWLSHDAIRQALADGSGLSRPTWASEHIIQERTWAREREARAEQEKQAAAVAPKPRSLLEEARRILNEPDEPASTSRAERVKKLLAEPDLAPSDIWKEVDEILKDDPPTPRKQAPIKPPPADLLKELDEILKDHPPKSKKP